MRFEYLTRFYLILRCGGGAEKRKKSRLVQGLCLISAPIFISLWSVLVNNYVTVEWRDITVEEGGGGSFQK